MPFILFLLAVAFVAHCFWVLAAFAAAAVLGRVIGGWMARRDDQRAMARARAAEVCARADRQHAAVLAGDELAGVYGDYPPAG
jgi:hypothetical protein